MFPLLCSISSILVFVNQVFTRLSLFETHRHIPTFVSLTKTPVTIQTNVSPFPINRWLGLSEAFIQLPINIYLSPPHWVILQAPQQTGSSGRLFMLREPKGLTRWVDLSSHQYPENGLLARLGWGFHPKMTPRSTKKNSIYLC